jgi:hypothetical protein
VEEIGHYHVRLELRIESAGRTVLKRHGHKFICADVLRGLPITVVTAKPMTGDVLQIRERFTNRCPVSRAHPVR